MNKTKLLWFFKTRKLIHFDYFALNVVLLVCKYLKKLLKIFLKKLFFLYIFSSFYYVVLLYLNHTVQSKLIRIISTKI